ncbi:hypothetical protein [Coleofasciculus sp. E1-EBD-02]|uniref:hypothetical protein n=1 Tax=Coleofasciculus sp. E1-EBD-02 TaxID=3068481 RepID=UPI003303AFE2
MRSPVLVWSIELCDRSLIPILINFIGRTSMRPYVLATNIAIACSIPCQRGWCDRVTQITNCPVVRV